MINKLIANLAFSPNLIEGIDFYTKRLNQESSVRKIGLIFIVLAMFVQMFAAAVPPEKSLAVSPDNDVIVDGVYSITQLQGKCYDDNYNDVFALLARFGLSCEEIDEDKIRELGVEKIHNDFDMKQKGAEGFRTVGRTNYNQIGTRSLGIFEGTEYFSRPANVWSGVTPAMKLGDYLGTDGNYWEIWIIKDCGNLAYKPGTKPSAPPTPVFTPITFTPPAETAPVYTPPVVTSPPITPAPPTTCKNTNSCKPAELHKEARNITQNLSSKLTSSTSAKANDVIEYTLTTTNTNEVEILTYEIKDTIGDILDYAEVDKSFLAEQGGSFSATDKTVAWPDQTIAANGELKKVFRVKMKNPLPNTNQPNSTAPDFDCKIENSYGDSVSIPVNCSVIKVVEKLPNTGPGETIGAAFAVTFISSYFFARSRLLAKELLIVKKNYKFPGSSK